MSDFDLVIRNGTVATAADTTDCDIGIKDGVVAILGKNLGPGAQEIDASGHLVLPGGIDISSSAPRPRSSAQTISTVRQCRRRLAGPPR